MKKRNTATMPMPPPNPPELAGSALKPEVEPLEKAKQEMDPEAYKMAMEGHPILDKSPKISPSKPEENPQTGCFSEALALMRASASAAYTRVGWNEPNKFLTFEKGVIYCTRDHRTFMWSPNQTDIVALDWKSA